MSELLRAVAAYRKTPPDILAQLVNHPDLEVRIQARLTRYRAQHPKSRANDLIVWAHRSGRWAQRRCVLCGERGPSFSTRWPKTLRAQRWEDDHRTSCPGLQDEPTT